MEATKQDLLDLFLTLKKFGNVRVATWRLYVYGRGEGRKMSSAKDLGAFIDRRRCVECGRYCLVKLGDGNYLVSACCNASVSFVTKKRKK